MSTSRERGRTTRAKILEATAELIARDGWSGFSTREIAARAGVTQGIVSYHWRSKDELVREAALNATTDALAPLGEVLDKAPERPRRPRAAGRARRLPSATAPS